MKKPIVFIISGFDPCNFAGYGSDIRVVSKIGAHPIGIITAMTSQIPKFLNGIMPINKTFIKKQLSLLFQNFNFKTIKIGMIYNEEIIETVYDFLNKKNYNVVIDPILKATAGPSLLKISAKKKYLELLFDKAKIITPNIPEAIHILNLKGAFSQKYITEKFFEKFNKPVLIKGGHSHIIKNKIKDILFDGVNFYEWEKTFNKKIDSHGSGCMLSSAIAAYLSKNNPLLKAISNAEKFISNSFNNPISINNQKYLSHF